MLFKSSIDLLLIFLYNGLEDFLLILLKMGMYDSPPMEKDNKRILIILIVVIDIIAIVILYMTKYAEIVRWTEMLSILLGGIVYFCIGTKDDIDKRYKTIKEKIYYDEEYFKECKIEGDEIRDDIKKEYNDRIKEKNKIENHYFLYYFKEIFPSCILGIPLAMCLASFFTLLPIYLLLTGTRQKEINHLPSLRTEITDCYIKGNIEFEGTEKIYHLPGCSHYNETVINPDFGEKWFCTEKEAREAGWRKCKEY